MGSAVAPVYSIEPPDQTKFEVEAPTATGQPSGVGDALSHAVDASTGFLQPVHKGLAFLRDKLGGYVEEKDHQALLDAAKTGKAPEGEAWSSFGPRMVKSLLNYATSATEPGNAALAAGTVAANTNPLTAIPVDAALVAHGGYGVAQNAPAAVQGNPDAAEAALMSGAETVGGAAGLGENVPRVPGAVKALPSAQTVKNTLGTITRNPETNQLRAPIKIVAAPTHLLGGPEIINELAPDNPTFRKAAIDKTLADARDAAYTQRAQDLMRRGREQAILDRQAAKAAPAPSNPPSEIVTPTGQSTSTLSASPSAPPIESEGRPATWTNQTVLTRSGQGDMTAIQQARLRGLPLPENANFVGNKSATVTPSVGARRLVMHFDANGNPIGPVPPTLPGGPADFANRMTLNPVGDTGARPLTADQFESSFGPEYQEVGDLAEWETGNREGVKPKKKVYH